MSNGTIVARVYTSRARIPVENAGFGVTQNIDDRIVLAGYRFTNENGHTAPITIETPNASNSKTPGNGKGYALCNIKVAHPAFETVEVENVQIFPGIETVQYVELIPLAEYPLLANEREVFNVTAQNL